MMHISTYYCQQCNFKANDYQDCVLHNKQEGHTKFRSGREAI